MATPQAVTAVIRASRPEFRCSADRLAFAVHAVVSVNGFSLRKFGDVAVDEAVAAGAAALPSEECGLEGWSPVQSRPQAEDGAGAGVAAPPPATYAFLYVPESAGMERQHKGSPPPLLLVKCLALVDAGAGGDAGGGVLLVSLADAATGRAPVTLELPIDRYVTSGGTYDKMDELIGRVAGALEDALEVPAASRSTGTKASAATGKTAAAPAGASTAGTSQSQQRQQQEDPDPGPGPDPLRDDRYRGAPRGPARGPPGYGVGAEEDWVPGGVPRPPGMGGGLMLPGGGGGFAGGGGMLVGPDNPIFADRLRHPRMGGPGMGGPGMGGPGMGPGSGVPGMRWDPIAPEGLQGWHPDDFTRDGRAMRGEGFNDIGRPPPGRGPDWDNMFG